MLNRVSKIGIPKVRAGNASPTTVSVLAAHITLQEAMVNPKKRLPESPINILAGLKLKNKKPVNAPKRDNIIIVIIAGPNNRESTAITPQVAAHIPAARPSKPSIRFIALVIPTIQRIVRGQENQPKFIDKESVRVMDLM